MITKKMTDLEMLLQDYENCQDVIIKGFIWELIQKEKGDNYGSVWEQCDKERR